MGDRKTTVTRRFVYIFVHLYVDNEERESSKQSKSKASVCCQIREEQLTRENTAQKLFLFYFFSYKLAPVCFPSKGWKQKLR